MTVEHLEINPFSPKEMAKGLYRAESWRIESKEKLIALEWPNEMIPL